MRAHRRSSIILGLLLLSYLGLRPDQGDTSASASMQDRDPAAYLHIARSHLISATGANVALRGVNLGGWLVTEAWMCGFTDSKDTKEADGDAGAPGRSTLQSLEDRFGDQRAAALMKTWEDHWITEKDLDGLQGAGFNLLRVPFSFRTLQHADGSWILTPDGRIDFGRMDWIVRQAAQRGMYVIFDLHVWPKQRTAYDAIGRPDGAQIRHSMAQLWTVIAAHYRGNGAIAAFDVINEFPGAWGVQQVLSQAVNAGDPHRIQVIEGFTFQEYLNAREGGDFPNSIFSEHLYGSTPLSTQDIEDRLQATLQSPAPIYIGEFLAADLRSATTAMTQRSVAWSSWTYKTVDQGDWGLVDYNPNRKTDIQHDSYFRIQSKWASDLTRRSSSHITSDAFVGEDRPYPVRSNTQPFR